MFSIRVKKFIVVTHNWIEKLHINFSPEDSQRKFKWNILRMKLHLRETSTNQNFIGGGRLTDTLVYQGTFSCFPEVTPKVNLLQM